MASEIPEIRPGMVAHTLNPRYSGLRDRKIVAQSIQEQKSYQDLISKYRLGVMHHTYNPINKGSGHRRIMVPQTKHI
jgi:hypothetical protein